MRTLKRYQTPFCFALRCGQEEITDENGNRTGEFSPLYGTKQEAAAHISVARGEYDLGLFGESADYDRVLLFETGRLPLSEDTVLWVDDLDASENDHIVTKVAKSRNFTLCAIRKVR